MKLFQTIAALLGADITLTLVIKNAPNGKMTVISNFTDKSGAIDGSLAPFTLKGSPQDIDEGFLDAIKIPCETVTGLVSNVEAFKKSAAQAQKNATSKPAAGTSTASNKNAAVEAMKKADEERKRKEAETKAKKENLDNAMKFAKQDMAHGNYFTAEAILTFASENLTDDKKVKAEIAKNIKAAIAPNKDGFLCNDDDEAARKALEEFKGMLVTAEKFFESAPAPETKTKDESADETDKEQPEDNGTQEDESETETA